MLHQRFVEVGCFQEQNTIRKKEHIDIIDRAHSSLIAMPIRHNSLSEYLSAVLNNLQSLAEMGLELIKQY